MSPIRLAGGLVVAREGFLAHLAAQLFGFLGQDPGDQLAGDRVAGVRQDHLVADLLPDLGAGDFRRGGVLHQVVDGHRAVAGDPDGGVGDGHVEVQAQPGLGDLALRRRRCPAAGPAVTETSGRCLSSWLGRSPEHGVEHLLADRHQVRVGHPGAVEAVVRLAGLVRADLLEGLGGDLGFAPVGDDGRHAAHGEGAAVVAGLDQQFRVGAHERRRHGHGGAVRQHKAGAGVAEVLDDAEQVVPAAGVQAGGVVAQLVEDLVHLERGRDGLDQHGGADGALAEMPR